MSFRQELYFMRHKVIITTISILILVVVVGGVIHLKQSEPTLPELGSPLAESTEIAPGSAKVWIGLKNSDDQGTNFDVQQLPQNLRRKGTEPRATATDACLSSQAAILSQTLRVMLL